MRIIVSRDISHSQYGTRVGGCDHVMAYVLGFRRLGHEAFLMEDVTSRNCLDPTGSPVPFDEWTGRARFESLTRAYGVWPRCCLIYNRGEATHGLSFAEALRVAETADLLVNIQGRLKTPAILERARCAAFVDINPAKTQVYHSVYGLDRGLDSHDHFFTVGLNIGTPDCEIPDCGRTWHGILPPVFLPLWPVRIDGAAKRFTTISNWSGKNTFEFQGKYSGEKLDQWRTFATVPAKFGTRMEVALNAPRREAPDLEIFRGNGWIVSDPGSWESLEEYRSFVAASRGEFSVANYRYVQFHTGWVSDRTARYLATGKPVVVQSTGIENSLPTGRGLLTFETLDEAVAALRAVDADYVAHCRHARRLAEAYFDSDKVLADMLRQVGVSPEALS